MAIFITGDTHGDFTRFKKEIFREQARLTKEDYVIICGDFGGVWNGSAEERYWLDWLEAKPYFTMGGASCHDIDGGILEPDDPQFKRRCRNLNLRGVLYRVNHRSWWKEELPGDEEYRTARANLEKCGWKVDYIVTHCGPISVQDEVGGGFYKADALTDFLEEVAERCQFKYWFFGHYHDNGVIRKKFMIRAMPITVWPQRAKRTMPFCFTISIT